MQQKQNDNVEHRVKGNSCGHNTTMKKKQSKEEHNCSNQPGAAGFAAAQSLKLMQPSHKEFFLFD